MRRPLRFCFLTTFYPPYSFGGDAIDVQRFARALAARGHHVTVVHDVDAYEALRNGDRSPASPSPDGVEVIGLRNPLGILSPLLTQQTGRPVAHGRRLARMFREQPFDVITFSNVSLVGGPGLLSLGGDAVRLYLAQEHWLVCPTHVLWRHNREACDERQCLRCVIRSGRPPQLWRYTGYLERQLRHVDTFVARSEFSRDKHREFGFSRPMQVLPYFLPALNGQASGNGSPHDRPYFLFVGRLEGIKGLHTLIPVFSRYPDADLLIAGDGTQASELESLAAANQRVRFVGRVENGALADYYRHAIASIVPSVGFETFGIVLIEAFQHGTPVLARNIGPFPEIIRQSGGGELFADEGELISAMSRLQHDPQYRAALSECGRRAAETHWSEEQVIGRYLDLVASSARARTARLGTVTPGWLDDAASRSRVS
jgi:glycosyltransferase involved in cell wall biosynthesis